MQTEDGARRFLDHHRSRIAVVRIGVTQDLSLESRDTDVVAVVDLDQEVDVANDGLSLATGPAHHHDFHVAHGGSDADRLCCAVDVEVQIPQLVVDDLRQGRIDDIREGPITYDEGLEVSEVCDRVPFGTAVEWTRVEDLVALLSLSAFSQYM